MDEDPITRLEAEQVSDAPRYPQHPPPPPPPHPAIFRVPVCTLCVQCWPYSARIPVWGRRRTLEFLHNNGILSDGAPPSFAPFPARGESAGLFPQQVQRDLGVLLRFISGGGGQCCAQKCVSVADVRLHMKKYDRVVAVRRELMFFSLSDWFTFLGNLLRDDYRHCCTHKHIHTHAHYLTFRSEYSHPCCVINTLVYFSKKVSYSSDKMLAIKSVTLMFITGKMLLNGIRSASSQIHIFMFYRMLCYINTPGSAQDVTWAFSTNSTNGQITASVLFFSSALVIINPSLLYTLRKIVA